MSWFSDAVTYAAGPMVYANKWVWNQVHKKKPEDPPYKFNSSAYGRTLPLAFGRNRITGNVIHLTAPSFGTSFQSDAIVALCEGPIIGTGRVWHGQDSKASAGDYGWTLATGTRPAAPWSVLTSAHAAQAIGYSGVAYLYRPQFPIRADMTQGYSYETLGFRAWTGGDQGDANGALVIADLITEAYGLNRPGLVNIDTGMDGSSDSSAWRYCVADGMFISPVLSEQRAASEHLSEILDAINCDLLWKDGKFLIAPVCDLPVTGNGATYTPAVNVQYALGPEDFIVDGAGDPISVEMAELDSTYNITPIEYLERTAPESDPSAAYNTSVVESPEPTDVARNGIRRAEPLALHSICRKDVATKISRIRAQRMCWSRTTFRFRLPWRFCRLEPLDLVSLTESLLGLAERVVRIERITENENLELEIEAVEWVFGTAGATLHDTQSNETSFYVPDGALPAWENAQRDLGNVPPQSVGEDLIKDGAVTIGKIAAGTITADMITTGTLSADLINGGTLNIDNINLAGTINNQYLGGWLYGSQAAHCMLNIVSGAMSYGQQYNMNTANAPAFNYYSGPGWTAIRLWVNGITTRVHVQTTRVIQPSSNPRTASLNLYSYNLAGGYIDLVAVDEGNSNILDPSSGTFTGQFNILILGGGA